MWLSQANLQDLFANQIWRKVIMVNLPRNANDLPIKNGWSFPVDNGILLITMASFAHRGSDGLLMAGRVAHLFHSDAKNSDSVWNFSINVGMAPKHSKMRYYIMDLEKLFGLSFTIPK